MDEASEYQLGPRAGDQTEVLPRAALAVAESFPGAVAAWPVPEENDYDPECYMREVVKVERVALAALGRFGEPRAAAVWQLYCGLDEWLATSDGDELTAEQRAIAGCALLEVYAVRGVSVSPSTARVVVSIVDLVDRLEPAGKAAIAEVCGRLAAREDEGPAGDEAVMLRVTAYVISGGLSEPLDQLEGFLAEHLDHREMHDDAVRECRGFVRRLLKWPGAPGGLRERWEGRWRL